MIRNMREKGMSIRSIAKEMGMSRNSVRKYLRNEPVKKHAQKRASKLDPYRDTIRTLIEKHNLSAVRIMEEIRKKGYDGGYTNLCLLEVRTSCTLCHADGNGTHPGT